LPGVARPLNHDYPRRSNLRREKENAAARENRGGRVNKYQVRYAKAVVRTLEKMSPDVRRRIRSKVERLSDGLGGDVKRLTNFSPEYRLRVGDWRVLFNVDGDTISVEHVSHRSQAY
jgi:mRNA interferase RelE/StbE